jgi:multiple sugar transport system substrate-binding protein
MSKEKQNMKTIGKALLVGLVACLLLAGCGKAQEKQVSFMIFGEPAEVAAYQALVDAFQVKYPHIRIDLRSVASQGDYLKQLVTAFSAGAEPDVLLLNHRRVAQFAAQGGLEALGPYLDKSKLLHAADLYPQALEAHAWDGKTWCIPQNVSSLVVYYNRALFDAAGVEYPAAGWTWEDFLRAARALTLDLDGDGKTDQYGAGVSAELMRLAPFIWQNGGELLDSETNPTRLALDSTAAMAAVHWFVDLQVKEHVVPDAAAEAAQDSETRFENGTLGMFFNSRRVVTTFRTISGLDWDVAPPPQGVESASILHSDGYCMSARAKDKEAAWSFIEFANDAEGQTIMAGTGRTVPSLREVAESSAFLDPNQKPEHSQVFLDVIPSLRHMPMLPEWASIEETANAEIERAFYGQAPLEEAVSTAIANSLQYFK